MGAGDPQDAGLILHLVDMDAPILADLVKVIAPADQGRLDVDVLVVAQDRLAEHPPDLPAAAGVDHQGWGWQVLDQLKGELRRGQGQPVVVALVQPLVVVEVCVEPDEGMGRLSIATLAPGRVGQHRGRTDVDAVHLTSGDHLSGCLLDVVREAMR